MQNDTMMWLPGGNKYARLTNGDEEFNAISINDSMSEYLRNHRVFLRRGDLGAGLLRSPICFRHIVKSYIDCRFNALYFEEGVGVNRLLDCFSLATVDASSLDSSDFADSIVDLITEVHNYVLYERRVNCRPEFTYLCAHTKDQQWYWRERSQYRQVHHGDYAILDISENVDEAEWASSLLGLGPDKTSSRELFWYMYGDGPDDATPARQSTNLDTDPYSSKDTTERLSQFISRIKSGYY